MSTETQDSKAQAVRDNCEAVRETVAEWMRHNADRIVSGEYVNDLPDTPVEVKLTRRDLRALNVLIAAVGLASDGTLGTMTKLVCQEITPRPIRRILRKVLIEAAPALEKIEEASPYRGEDLLATRGEALKELVLEATEGMESW